MTETVLKRPLFFACAVACACAFLFSFFTPVTIFAFLLVMIFAISFMIPFKCRLIMPSVLALVLCIIIAISSSLRYYLTFIPACDYAGTAVTVNGTVLSVDGDEVVIKCNTISLDDSEEKVRFKISARHTGVLQLFPSSVVIAKVTFDDGVSRNGNSGTVLSGEITDITAQKNFELYSPRYTLYKIRTSLMSSLPFESDTNAFMKAMLFGDKSDISDRFINKMNLLGISHFIAVSGLHLVFAVVLLDFILSLFYLGYRTRAVVAIISIVFFTVISGFSVSCVRAAIMMSVYYIGRVAGKIPDSLTSLSVASFAILVFTPYNVASLSFILSASATFGIIVLMPCFNSLVAVKFKSHILNGLYYTVTSAFTMSLSAILMTLPITAICFDRFCVISPFVNVILSLLMQAVFYIGAFAVIFSFVPFLKPVFAFLGDNVYNLIDLAVDRVYNIENITVGGGYRLFYLVLVLLFVLVIGVYVFYKKKLSVAFTAWYVCAYASFCLLLFVLNLCFTAGDVGVSFVDVGQGSCTVVSYGERASLIDCGGEDYHEITDVLSDHSVKNIDKIALTHVDYDHVCFLRYIVSRYEVGEIMLPHFSRLDDIEQDLKFASESGAKITYLEEDCGFSLCDDVSLKVYVERAEPVKHTNNLSAVYKLSAYNNTVLFTGDMNIYQEYSYLGYGDELDIDVLLVSHHGSKTSSHPQFIELCSPEYSVISVAENNSLNLPASTVVERLKKVSAVLSTADESTVRFNFNKKGYKLIK